MSMTADQKTQIVSSYQVHEKDSGSPEVQIALITQRINDLRQAGRLQPRPVCLRRPTSETKPLRPGL